MADGGSLYQGVGACTVLLRVMTSPTGVFTDIVAILVVQNEITVTELPTASSRGYDTR